MDGLLGATSRQSWDLNMIQNDNITRLLDLAPHLKGLLVSVLGWLAIIFPMSHVVPGVVAVGERGVPVVVRKIAPVGGGEMAVVGGERHRLDGPRSSWLCRLSIFSSVT